jgi:hypothetical protein
VEIALDIAVLALFAVALIAALVVPMRRAPGCCQTRDQIEPGNDRKITPSI